MKKVLYVVLSLIMLLGVPMMAMPMNVSANASDYETDYSPSGAYDKEDDTKGTQKATSPKTGDYSMVGLAFIVCILSGGVILVSNKELKRA